MRARIYRGQIIRVVSILVLTWMATFYFPPVVFEEKATLTNPTFGLIIFVFVAGFLINEAIVRTRRLDIAISHELSRLRRIVHLTEVMSASEKWKGEVKAAVIAYLCSVGNRHFKHYDESHEDFRVITHLIYTLKPKSERDRIIFAELLEVTRDLSYQRQQVAHYLQASVSPHTWAIMIIILIINVALLLGAREPGFTSQLFIFGSVAGLLLVFDILYDLDALTRPQRLGYQRLYTKNAADMEAHEHDE